MALLAERSDDESELSEVQDIADPFGDIQDRYTHSDEEYKDEDEEEDSSDDDYSSVSSEEYERRKMRDQYEWELHYDNADRLNLKPDPEVDDKIDEDEDEDEDEEMNEDEDAEMCEDEKEDLLTEEDIDNNEKGSIEQLCSIEAEHFNEEAR